MNTKRMKRKEVLVTYVTPKTVSVVLTLLYLISLIPLLLIARYNYPSADDYSIGETCYHAWTATHHIFPVLGEAVRMAVYDYFHWMGYFSSIFFMSLHPGVFGEEWYSLTTWIMVGMLSLSTLYLFRGLLVKALKMDKYLCHSISMITLYVMVQCMVGRTEAFYWFCGGVNYIFLHSAGMFMLGAMISAVYAEDRKKRMGNLIVASVMGVWAGAGNYMTALVMAILLLAGAALMGYRKQWRDHKFLLIPAGFYFAAFAASVLAPGNSVRAAGASGMSPLKAIFVSFYYAFDYALSDWTNWVVIGMVVILIPLFWKGAKQTKFSFPYPLPVAVFSFCLLSATVTPPLFAVGNIMAGRLQALIFIMYLLLLTLNVGYLTGWVQKRLEGEGAGNLSHFSFHTISLLLTCGGFFLFGTVLSVIPEPHYFTFSSAIADLANGSAKAYGDALKERADILKGADEEAEISFEPLPAKPTLLYFDDIRTESGEWQNRAVARYYGVSSVALQKEKEKK